MAGKNRIIIIVIIIIIVAISTKQKSQTNYIENDIFFHCKEKGAFKRYLYGH